MKKLLIKLIILFLPLIVLLEIFLYLYGDGKTDEFYLRFTTPTFNSLILGSSKAAQAIKPSIFNESDLSFEGPVYNFSFTITQSPWGPYYLDAIKKKLNKKSSHGLFILEVNPVTISFKGNKDGWTEKNSYINSFFVSGKPNLEYILRYFNRPYLKIFLDRKKDKLFSVSEDGWLQLDIPMDKLSVEKRKIRKFEEYKKTFETSTVSSERIMYLEKTIRFLKDHGTVVLVRLPSSKEMRDMEMTYMPNFDEKMQSISESFNILYVNMIDDYDQYQTTDGNHLSKISAELLSKNLLQRIQSSMRETSN